MARPRPEELGEWFEAHAAAMALYARQWLNGDGAQDTVQTAFLRLAGQTRRPKDVKAWLFRVVRNAAIDELRTRRRRQRHDSVIAAAGPEWFHARLEDGLDAQSAQEALARLPQALREVVVLRIWGQCSFAEVAAITGAPLSTVFSRYQSALEMVRQRMVQPCKTKP